MIDEIVRTTSERLAATMPRRGAVGMLGKGLLAAGTAMAVWGMPRVARGDPGPIVGCPPYTPCGCGENDCKCPHCAPCGECPNCNPNDPTARPTPPGGGCLKQPSETSPWCWTCCVNGCLWKACDYSCPNNCHPCHGTHGCCKLGFDGVMTCFNCYCYCKAPIMFIGACFPCSCANDCDHCNAHLREECTD
jgi:hypothetical protein